MSFSKLVGSTYSATSKAIQRYFQTVRSVEPSTAAGLVQGINFESLPVSIGRENSENVQVPPFRKEIKIAEILEQVKGVDGLQLSPSHIEHLVGRATKGRIYQNHALLQEQSIAQTGSHKIGEDVFTNFANNQDKYEVGGIDIAEKTQLILQSPHPVRYVIERQLYNSQQGLRVRLPSYHTWIMLFGRSLATRTQRHRLSESNHDKLLNDIANASDSGMFSADIHHTIIDIPYAHPALENYSDAQFHMGNKYAVLVGDYFAIRCIYHAERTKTNSVMVAITEGVEEFTTSTFGTNLFDKGVGYPLVLSPTASAIDWVLYTQKAFGYLKGGLYAAMALHYPKLNESRILEKNMNKFVANLSAFLKATAELEALEQSDVIVPSPFLLSSLPAVLYQLENPDMLTGLRQQGFEFDNDRVRELHDAIRRSTAPMRTKTLIAGFANETKHALERIAKDQYYIHVFDSLLDAIMEGG